MDLQAVRVALRRAAAPGPPRLEVLRAVDRSPDVVGLVPGSFDPLTAAHVELAEALRRAGADLVLLTYAVRTLPKERRAPPPLLPPERRLLALAAYCEPRSHLAPAVSSHGLYADQAEAAAATFPGAAVVLAMGSEKLRQLLDPRWYEDREAALERLFRAAEVAYAPRHGDPSPVEEAAWWRSRIRRLDVPPGMAAVSSGEVRERVRRGEPPGADVPPEVHAFLAAR
ncbi:MAG TPA: hypothetical protein VHL78_01990 [Actinomycetota bacterium]|nr:hypothetical protein [Actinomycetota bacterium]